MKPPLWAGLYIGWITILIWLSLASDLPRLETGLAFEDKVKHALAYFVLVILGNQAWRLLPMVRRPWLWALLTALVLGAGLEFAQAALTRARKAEWGDWIADGLGAILALCIVGFLRRRKERRSV